MSLSRRLKQLEKGPLRAAEDGSCCGCWHRKKCVLTVHDDEPLPVPCCVCGRIPEALVYIYTPADGKSEKNIPEVLEKASWLAVFPDDGRGS
jgi:hypothetical protein